MLTIREAMEIEAFKKVKLIAGKEGIDRVIESVTVMEVTDTVQWPAGWRIYNYKFLFGEG